MPTEHKSKKIKPNRLHSHSLSRAVCQGNLKRVIYALKEGPRSEDGDSWALIDAIVKRRFKIAEELLKPEYKLYVHGHNNAATLYAIERENIPVIEKLFLAGVSTYCRHNEPIETYLLREANPEVVKLVENYVAVTRKQITKENII